MLKKKIVVIIWSKSANNLCQNQAENTYNLDPGTAA